MGLILCESANADHPMFIPDMGLKVYSLEELCYVIYNYPLIAMDGLADFRLIGFLKNELKIGLQIINLERSLSDSPHKDEILPAILNLSDYYSPAEVDEFRTRITELEKLPRYEFYRQKGDLLFKLGQYGKAVSCYESSLVDSGLFNSNDKKADDVYFYRVYRNMGCTYANIYQLDEAFDAFTQALKYKPDDEDVIKRIYFLAKLQDNIEKKQHYLEISAQESNAEWDKEFEDISLEALDDASLAEIDNLDSLDSVKKHRAIETILNGWKRKYRNMF